MSRYENVLNTGLAQQQAEKIVRDYLGSEGFKPRNERGEAVWRKGVGALANPQFIKTEYLGDGAVRIQAWTAGIALLPGAYAGELDPMQGGYGWAIKRALKKRVVELERRLGAGSAGL